MTGGRTGAAVPSCGQAVGANNFVLARRTDSIFASR